ncbi:hypothetical protein FA95DRAFT_1120881 [Auriscalpium vulgare]|uniref:Uncharacterized protein n=1 Tax=Auriscalpium vulgare TaxID=40419 RepID=A0ACB8RWI7_9AGAM|nr:hypothetical protein FA95DRAFT_1120881 [Auriscalpium vulgare]
MPSSQPIALPAQGSVDHAMQSPPYPFNPASYTRQVFGSPVSWRPSSFGSRFYPGESPGQLLGPLECVPHTTPSVPPAHPATSPTDFRGGRMSSSIESDRGSILNALQISSREEELCRNYTCCGYNLPDLHALVDHFEEHHVVVLDPYTQQPQLFANVPAPHQPHHPHQPHPAPPPSHHQQLHQYQQPRPGYFDPDDMELEMDDSPPSSSSSSPPHTPSLAAPSSYGPSHTPSSAYSTPAYVAKQPAYYPPSYDPTPLSSACPSPVSAFDTTAVLPSRAGVAAFPPVQPQVRTPPAEAFNAYSGYAEFPGAHGAEAGVQPALLYAGSATSRQGSPTEATQASPKSAQAGTSKASSSTASSSVHTARASTTLSRPASSLLLSKPFRCPKPNCNKSYKQANGLKYHMTHGSCNFAPPKDLEALASLLAEKGMDGGEGTGNMTEGEMREVEREAERRLRPFACGVGDCQRRYKNMNGLRYHYQHSGEHGAQGLQLLASGQHESLQHTQTPRASAKTSRAATPQQPHPSSHTHTHHAVPQQQQPQHPTPAQIQAQQWQQYAVPQQQQQFYVGQQGQQQGQAYGYQVPIQQQF